MVHATRTFIRDNRDTNFVLLKIDAKNAFNSIERDIMLSAVLNTVPSIYNYIWQCYSSPSTLFFGDYKIQSKIGCQQGDPCGSMLFSLTIHPIITSLLSDLNLWYLDDGTLAGPPETVLKDLASLISRFKNIGLEINPSKCELFFLNNIDGEIVASFNELTPGIKILDNHLELLGAPLTSTSTKTILQRKYDEMKLLFSRLKDLNSSHMAFFLLKNCLYIPKLTYLLRCSLLEDDRQSIERMDLHMKSTLESIINIKLTDSQWTTASLPISFGGLGTRKICDLTLPAFLSSCNSTSTLVNFMLNKSSDEIAIDGYQEALSKWTSSLDTPTALKELQSSWDHISIANIISSIQLTSERDIARSLASSTKESGAWLHALPSRSIGTLLDNNSFRISTAIRLGCNICVPHTCTCGSAVDESGSHALSCKKSLGRHSRHAEINNILCRSLRSANIPCILEPTGLFRNDGKRADGMSLIPWKDGKILVWDATVSDTLAPSYLSQSVKSPGAVAHLAAQRKVSKYINISEDPNYIFIPFAIETLGPWCTEAISFMNSIGSLIHQKTGDPKSKTYIIQRISVAIQRGNSASIMGSFNNSNKLEEIFYIL